MDDYILFGAGKQDWEIQKERECKRAYEFSVRMLKSPLTYEEFKSCWYSEHDDKKGVKHLANMCMSIFQSRKATAGASFESSIYSSHAKCKIEVIKQAYVDSEGNVYIKKPKRKDLHKVDALIPTTENRESLEDMYVLSMKTTSRERWRQDVDLVSKCKGVIFLTKEKPDKAKIESITGYGMKLVYPNADISEHVWSYQLYFEKIKQLICDDLSK
jgi:EcoRII C terminal